MKETQERTIAESEAGSTMGVVVPFRLPMNGTKANLRVREDSLLRAIRLSTTPHMKMAFFK